MAKITLENVTVEYPVYGASHKSFRKALLGRTGGNIRQQDSRHHHVVVRALEDISFVLNDGDRVGLVGHNGAGKSTLLRVLADIYLPTAGKIAIEGRVSSLFNSSPGLDMDDTGYENIMTCGMFLGMTAAEIKRKTPEIAEFSELGEYLKLPVRTYSTGMVTRLGFAIATSVDPGVLLLDEGLATGDARFAARAEARFAQLIGRSSILVLASHSDAMIRAMCNRAILLERGKMLAFGEVDEIFELYQKRMAESTA
jgi:ABC-type polysaccharide/polyol phosphate transport system ATPase subunit